MNFKIHHILFIKDLYCYAHNAIHNDLFEAHHLRGSCLVTCRTSSLDAPKPSLLKRMSSLISGGLGSPSSSSVSQTNYGKALAKSGLPVPLLIVKEDSLGQAAADVMPVDDNEDFVDDFERESSRGGPQRPAIKAAVEVNSRNVIISTNFPLFIVMLLCY